MEIKKQKGKMKKLEKAQGNLQEILKTLAPYLKEGRFKRYEVVEKWRGSIKSFNYDS